MRKKVVALFLAMCMAAVVALAGCSSSQPAQQKPAEPAAKQETAKKPQTVVIAYTPWLGYGALFVAKEKGMFQKRGVDVEIQSIEGVGDRKQSLVANRIQAMAASLDVSVSAAGEGVPMKFVWAFDASDGADGLMVRKDAGIEKIADLKGKQVAFHIGSSSHFFMSTVLGKAGLTDSDIKIVDMKASEVAAAFTAGKVEAAVTWEPHLSKAKANGDIVLASTKDTPGLIADVLAVREDFVKNNPETVQAMVDALAEASEYINTNPAEADKILADVFKMKPEEISQDRKTTIFYGLKDNKEFFGTKEKPGKIFDVAKQASDFYVKLKLISKAPDLNHFIDPTFITNSK